MGKLVLIPNSDCRDLLWDRWHTFEMSESDSKSSQYYTLHSTHLCLIGNVGPRLLPCSWDLFFWMCSVLLRRSFSIPEYERPAYSSVILFIFDFFIPHYHFPHPCFPFTHTHHDFFFFFSFFLFPLSLLIDLCLVFCTALQMIPIITFTID